MVEFHFIDLLPKPKFTLDTWRKESRNSIGWFCSPPPPADKAAYNAVIVWKRYYINTLKQELSTEKHMDITGLMRRLSLKDIDTILQLSLGCLLMRTIASFLRYPGYPNFIKGPISHVLLLILVHVQLLSCLFFWILASLRLKTMPLNIAQQFMKEKVKIILVY